MRFTVSEVDVPNEYPGIDIAVLKVNAMNSDYLPLLPQDEQTGEDVVAIGHPNQDWWNLSKGIVSRTYTDYKYLLQHDVAIDEGNSGGPLINKNGQVVGVVNGYQNMFDGRGKEKTQETGKFAVKISYVRNHLNSRGIKFYTNQLIADAAGGFEGQFKLMQEERDFLTKDRSQLLRQQDSLWRDRTALESEKTRLKKERSEFEIKKQESSTLLLQADAIKKDIQAQRDIVEAKLRDVREREAALERRTSSLDEKEARLSSYYTPRMVWELLVNPACMFNEKSDNAILNLNGSMGLFFRFGFERNYNHEVTSSDRIGLIYNWRKDMSLNSGKFANMYFHDVSLAAEFNETVRFGIGRSLKLKDDYYGKTDYFKAFININTTGYPVPFGFSFAYITDKAFTLSHFSLGLYCGVGLGFLRL